MLENDQQEQKDQSNDTKAKQLYKERFHIENLLNTRFNFFIVILAVILASTFTAKSGVQLGIMVGLGGLIELFLTLTILRAQAKLDYYLEAIRKDRSHAETLANDFVNTHGGFLARGSKKRIIGKWMPITISLLLILITPFSCPIFNLLNSKDNSFEVKISNNLDSIFRLMKTDKVAKVYTPLSSGQSKLYKTTWVLNGVSKNDKQPVKIELNDDPYLTFDRDNNKTYKYKKYEIDNDKLLITGATGFTDVYNIEGDSLLFFENVSYRRTK